MHDEFWRAITTAIGSAVQAPGRESVRAQLDTAWAAGWSPAALSAWALRQVRTARRPITNRPGFVVAQLRAIPAPSEAGPVPGAPHVTEWCQRGGRAADEDPCDERTRHREGPDGTLYRCPICHSTATPRPALTSVTGEGRRDDQSLSADDLLARGLKAKYLPARHRRQPGAGA
jgi:hypothetical protein